MGSKPFQFKQFSVHDAGSTHKVGTDGVLLGSWISVRPDDSRILDIGTGSGLIAIMLAQRSGPDARIDAVEIEPGDVLQANENVKASPWPDKVKVWHVRAQDFSPHRHYDIIASNPPFFANSLHPPNARRSRARHSHELSISDLVTIVDRLLAPSGRFGVILPEKEALELMNLGASRGLFPLRRSVFRSRRDKPVERLLLELSREKAAADESEILLYEEGEHWSAGYRTVTKDFYLKA